MTYPEIVRLIFTIITMILAIPSIHFIVFGIVGVFKRKTYPKAKKYRKYGIIIPARNEEKVVANLIESAKKNNYPQELLTIFVIAHNCTDNTAQVSRDAGAVVYEYNNPNECTMGYAFRHLFQCIERDYGTQNFDGFFLFNADNILAEDYFEKMNDAFEYYGEKDIITSFRNSKNFGQNLLSGMYGMLFAGSCLMEGRGRTVCGCSTRVMGTGYVINSKVVKDGWKYVTLTEDWEFSGDQILQGNKIRYCDEAMFYDEQPTSVKIMFRQRLRWAKGMLLVFKEKCFYLLGSVFQPKAKNKGSRYDFWAQVLPYAVVGLFMGLLQTFLLSPIFGVPFFEGLSFWEYVMKNWMTWLLPGVFGYLLYVVRSVLVFVVYRKRIQGVSFINKVLIVLLFPLFEVLFVPIQLVALVSKVGWKPIPHKEAISHDQLNGEVAATVAKKQTRSKSAARKVSKVRVSKKEE